MRAVITGGSGFAGLHLAEHLLGQGYEVILIDRPAADARALEHLRHQVKLERADLRDFGLLRKILGDARPERIFHLAAFSSVVDSFRHPRECYSTNFDGTLNLLEAWRELQFDTRVLLVSSSDVYGRPGEAEMPLQEDSPLRPASHYGASKVAAELLAVQFGLSHGLPVVRVRPFQHTGPRQSPDFVCSELARQVAEIACGVRPPWLAVGNPDIARDFSDVRDIVRGYALLLEQGRPGEVYQLCSGRAVSVGALIECLSAMVPMPIEVRIDSARARAGDCHAMWGDPAKARAETGWAPTHELRTTLSDLKSYWEGRVRENAVNAAEHSARGGIGAAGQRSAVL
ncbi:MAG TPA: GDP-mannose 4,6-dehydratase [Terriglobia bacterium]|nr:GDP-mannose 4,6-dehydratase [Terriglobia bacterium]